jgi:1-acyl-sn-glycerol-3-phosphate acyltransferase
MLRKLFLGPLQRWYTPLPAARGTRWPQDSARPMVLATRSDSMLVEAIVRAVAARESIQRVEQLQLPSVSSLTQPPSTDSAERVLYWFAYTDLELLKCILPLLDQISLHTLNTFALKGPVSSYPRLPLDFLDQVSLFLSRRSVAVVLGARLELSGGSTKRHTPSPARLERLIELDFYRNLKLVRGTPFQPLEQQMRLVLQGPELERELGILSRHYSRPVTALRAQARSTLATIAANPRRPMYSVLSFIARNLLKRLFSNIQTTGLDQLATVVREHTVVLVPMHRSHLDYILIGQELYAHNFNPPLVAAGINLSFWPIGFILRSVGAYFVKRNARHDRLNSLVLRRYVKYLLRRGHLQEFFIEGGRSRSGKMLPPKLGLLSVMVDAYLKGLRKDIYFVPVAISYENVIEDRAFGEENTGRSKREENLVELVRARKVLRNRYGEVLLNFGTPLSLAAFQARLESAPGLKSKLRTKTLTQELGFYLVREIRSRTNPSLGALACTCLMMAPSYALTRSALESRMRGLAELMRINTKVEPQAGAPTPALAAFLAGDTLVLNQLVRSGLLEYRQCLGEEVFVIPGKLRFTADFYRNSVLHIFFIPALLDMLKLLPEGCTPEALLRWKQRFGQDLLLPPDNDFLQSCSQIEQELERVRAVPHTVCAPVPELLLAPIQALLWVLLHLRSLGRASEEADGKLVVNYTLLLEAMQRDFRSAGYLGLLGRTEAAARSTLISVLDSLLSRQVVSISERGGKRENVTLLQDSSQEIVELRLANTRLRHYMDLQGQSEEERLFSEER